MNKCQNCFAEFPNFALIQGKERNLSARKYCLSCSPFGCHNTRKIHVYHKNWNEDEFRVAVANSISVAGTLRYMVSTGLTTSTNEYGFVYQEVSRLGLNISHWHGPTHGTSNCRPLAEVLVKNSGDQNIRPRILTHNLLESRCAKCHLTNWRDQPISFELDHMNGDPTDNRMENLRFLCPSCHTQTPTWGGKNKTSSKLPVKPTKKQKSPRSQLGREEVISRKFIQRFTGKRNTSLREAILQYGLLPHQCEMCRLGTEWQGLPLTLQVDHINGKKDDDRLVNLRFLCPNCHSQTPNFRNRRKPDW